MKKAIYGVFLAALIAFTARFSAYAEDKADYEYTIIGGEATITGFTGEPDEVEIPDFIGSYPVTEVRDNAFFNCNTLKRVTLPDTVTKLGHHCFYACYSLESVKLPEGLEEIGEGCFCGCTALENVSIPETVEELPDSCFRACTALTEADMPDELRIIGDFCFAGCVSLERADIGEKLTSVGERAFYMCEELKSVYLPPSCTDIGEQSLGYTCDGNTLLMQKDMVITGNSGSAAEDYAEVNEIDFSPVEAAFAELKSVGEKKAPAAWNWSGILVFLLLILALLRLIFLDDRDKKLK